MGLLQRAREKAVELTEGELANAGVTKVREILSLPIYGELALEDVDYVCDTIAEFLK